MPFFRFFRPKRKIRRIPVRTDGKHYDLKSVYDKINAQYFEGKLSIAITWFSPKKLKYRRKIVLGVFQPHYKLIKVNQILDVLETPAYFIDFIVYHEMLHAVHPPVVRMWQRRKIHHATFKQREKEFQDYQLAREFLNKSKERWFLDAAIHRS